MSEKIHFKIQWQSPDGAWHPGPEGFETVLESRGYIAAHVGCCVEPMRIVKVTTREEVVS